MLHHTQKLHANCQGLPQKCKKPWELNHPMIASLPSNQPTMAGKAQQIIEKNFPTVSLENKGGENLFTGERTCAAVIQKSNCM